MIGSGILCVCVCVCVCVLVTQSCPTLCNPMDCSLPGSSVHEIFQARILEWVAISFSRGSSQPKDRTRISCTIGEFFTDWATREALNQLVFHIPRVLVIGSGMGVWDLNWPHCTKRKDNQGEGYFSSLLAIFRQLLLTTLLAAFGKVSLSMKLRHLGGQIWETKDLRQPKKKPWNSQVSFPGRRQRRSFLDDSGKVSVKLVQSHHCCSKSVTRFRSMNICWVLTVAQRVKPLPAMRVRSLGQEDPLVKEVATHSGTLAWKILWTEKPGPLGHKTIVHWVAKSQTWLRDFTFTFHDSERRRAGKESLTYCVALS